MLTIKDGMIKRGKYRLDNINIEIPKNTITILVGRNASGKSTLIDGLIGTLPLSKGSIKGNDQKIAYVGTSSPFDDRVEGMLMSDVMPEVDDTFDKKKFREYLEEFSIPVHLNVSEMSTGQKKLFTLALGLARDTDLLILDEIDTNLDVIHKMKLERIFADYMERGRRSILVSTNQPELYDDFTDQIIYIKNNMIFYAGEASRLLNQYSTWIGSEDDFEKLNPEEIVYFEANKFNIKALLNKPSSSNSPMISEVLQGLERSKDEKIHIR